MNSLLYFASILHKIFRKAVQTYDENFYFAPLRSLGDESFIGKGHNSKIRSEIGSLSTRDRHLGCTGRVRLGGRSVHDSFPL